MAEQVVTIKAVFENTGSSSKGPWTRYDIKDAGGNKYQTFSDALGQKAHELKGKSAKVTYHEEERGGYVNKVVDGIEAAGSETAQAAPSQDEFRRSKEEMRRTEAVKAAATLIASPGWEGQVDVYALAELAEAVAKVMAGELQVSERI